MLLMKAISQSVSPATVWRDSVMVV